MGDTSTAPSANARDTRKKLPRLGFLGVGWIGRNRMEVIAKSGLAEIAAVYDASPEILQQSLAVVRQTTTVNSYDELLNAGIDGVVIATPSAQHAEQSALALERGLPVFCQKPLGRTAQETRRVVEAARKANRLLAVDMAYRFTAALQAVHTVISSGMLGEIYAANLVFHNAYGPDKEWFYDRARSGGGCLMDLGIHLMDAALWMLGFPPVLKVNSRLYMQGRHLDGKSNAVEDYATAQIETASGVVLNLTCSWRLSVGQDCIISAEFFGTRGGVSFHNVNGSFYDFVAERYEGTKRIPLISGPDSWPGRAGLDWVERLQKNERFDPKNAELVRVAEVLDAIYHSASIS
jgi:predicted dehydrogenase